MPDSMVLVDKKLILDGQKQVLAFGVAIRFLRQIYQAAQTTDDRTVTVSINAIAATINEMDDILNA